VNFVVDDSDPPPGARDCRRGRALMGSGPKVRGESLSYPHAWSTSIRIVPIGVVGLQPKVDGGEGAESRRRQARGTVADAGWMRSSTILRTLWLHLPRRPPRFSLACDVYFRDQRARHCACAALCSGCPDPAGVGCGACFLRRGICGAGGGSRAVVVSLVLPWRACPPSTAATPIHDITAPARFVRLKRCRRAKPAIRRQEQPA
jgi:hypothetical protein